jgi:hypothetical protein
MTVTPAKDMKAAERVDVSEATSKWIDVSLKEK